MPISSSSAAQAARECVARRLRELRQDAGLTGTELAARCGGWSHAKVSRIENARTPPSSTDIRLWCRACDATEQAADIIAASHNAESLYVEWRRRQRTGLRQLQESYIQLFRSTRLFRVYSGTLVPGLLQTEGYATALLSAITSFREIPDDVSDAVAARLERSRILHETGHRFLFLLEEEALRHQVGDSEAMAAQLGHLLSAGALPSVAMGIIPFAAAARSAWPLETFHIYDDTLVSIELLSARVTVTQPHEIALYLKAFDQLRGLAVYGAEARALIVNAIEALPGHDE
ncbi:helix-turn-helix domain-containing protein [Streptomyces gobiensis]|uniref:helix-turn-helix domain-containing protein n=1 Tax=Streptomyces gobiensis TaxID=2875706 RepID=UPI001E3F7208|nr:helix-turn-helix transcriptional regulator [Streptomyces gobiensis]UGY92260.1 helix-turn-helix transcriptional regulator [Streptomyces gobiensis]